MSEDVPESEQPWSEAYYKAGQRCNNPKFKFYARYGGRGIKRMMTREDFKTLWFRDKAYLMNRPSIDRIDNDGNYELKNCRYIEQSENARKMHKPDGNFCIRGHKLVKGNLYSHRKNKKPYYDCKICSSERGRKYYHKNKSTKSLADWEAWDNKKGEIK